jgi:hypothetical protein
MKSGDRCDSRDLVKTYPKYLSLEWCHSSPKLAIRWTKPYLSHRSMINNYDVIGNRGFEWNDMDVFASSIPTPL